MNLSLSCLVTLDHIRYREKEKKKRCCAIVSIRKIDTNRVVLFFFFCVLSFTTAFIPLHICVYGKMENTRRDAKKGGFLTFPQTYGKKLDARIN